MICVVKDSIKVCNSMPEWPISTSGITHGRAGWSILITTISHDKNRQTEKHYKSATLCLDIDLPIFDSSKAGNEMYKHTSNFGVCFILLFGWVKGIYSS